MVGREGKDGFVKRAKVEKLREIFNKYASVEKNGEKYMSPEDFVSKFLGFHDYSSDSIGLLASAVNIQRNGRISFSEFQAFEDVLSYPDALYRTIFQLFDLNGDGEIRFSEFEDVVKKTDLYKKIPTNFDSSFIELYFGKNKDKSLSYSEFVEFLHDFSDEYVIEGFRHADKNGTGFISVFDFQDIMINTRSYLLTKPVESVLLEIAHLGPSSKKISFPYFIAFNSLLKNMELVKRIYLHGTHNKRNEEISEGQFLQSAQVMSQMSPLEVDMLFHLCQLLHQRKRIVYNDLNEIAPQHYFSIIADQAAGGGSTSTPVNRGALMIFLESLYRFSVGFIAGAVGATVVFPIDLVKTRIQNQRMQASMKEARYKGYIDCFYKVVKYEGFLGLYRGLFPQLVGVSPEKAIKLMVNDFVRDKFYEDNGDIKYRYELLAGASAGCCQVVVTNPIEIIKIRLQTAGEVAGGQKVKARNIIRDLGIAGLYKGVRACLMRDITFGALYFSSYARLKKKFADETGYNNPISLLAAGTGAGVPAAATATPFDVIKTRLQVIPKSGETTYTGVIDAVTKIMREEGPRAFLKGALARVCRSSPQLGITLFTYELLQRFFVVDFGGRASSGSRQALDHGHQVRYTNPDHVGGYSVAVPVFVGIETRFGISLPKFRVTRPSSDE